MPFLPKIYQPQDTLAYLFTLLLECLEENDCSDQDTKNKCNTAVNRCAGNGSTIIQGQHAKYDTMFHSS